MGFEQPALDAVEAAFTHLAEGRAVVPPIMMIEVPGRGEVDVKSAFIDGLDAFAVKIASGFACNAERGLPTTGGLMVVVSSQTGFPEAVLMDGGYLTDLRTALAGAVAAKHLARSAIDCVAVMGTGGQARYQVRALALVRSFNRVLVYGRRREAAEACAADIASALDVEASAAGAEETVRGGDIVITATATREPLVRAEWLKPGVHITAMGSDTPGKRELGPGVLRRADLIVCDLWTQASHFGELQASTEEGITSDDVHELGELTSGRVAGRTDDRQITICDLTGVGVQDTAIALYALDRAREKGLR